MIRSGIRVLALFTAIAGPLGTAAVAQNRTPTLRDSVTVTSDVVHIGDLIENAGAVADVPIFRSPDLGTRGAVATERVIEAIRPHQLIDIDTRGLAAVVVTRSSRTITAQEISSRIAQLLADQFNLGDAHNISVNFDHDVRALQIEPTVTGELLATALAYDPRTGRFDVTLDLPSSAVLHRQPARFTGTAVETVDAIAVAHTVERSEVLSEADLTMLRRPKSEGAPLSNLADVVGRAARHQLRPGQPLHAADLMKPEIVQRNDPITIVYQAPGLMLTLRGQAQEAGGLGDSIGVLNVQSKRVVQGTITGPGRVMVSALATRVVENGLSATLNSAPAPVE
ncbi:MAG TPA: flagellar basal body P-ring formation chaperone FlgA [Xanthobacteraceae bacterium]|nr:flagellar basal body P-ring formation chaperone FlgA [Xanthobacteraceae bacterium]